MAIAKVWRYVSLGAALLGALGVWAAAIDLPEIGDPSGAIISPEQEKLLGARIMREARRSGAPIVDDPELEAYLDGVGQRLVSNVNEGQQPFNFFLLTDDAINAFALPGGYIGVHSGLMLTARTESELAGVLAHEIAHVTQKHMARQFEEQKRMTIPMLLAMLGAVALASQNPQGAPAILSAVNAGGAQHMINFTRAHEEEADRVGMQYLYKAGFDPKGMPSFFQRMQQANRFMDDPNLPEFLRTHPMTTNRIADSRERAERFTVRTLRENPDYYFMQAKLKALSLKSPAEAVQYFARIQSTAPAATPQALANRYGYAIALTMAGRYSEAHDVLDALLKAAPGKLVLLLANANLELEERHFDRALAIYARLYGLYPDYHPVTLNYAHALLLSGQTAKARVLLRQYVAKNSHDPRYYALLSEAEGKSGATIEALIALAESRYLAGETLLACEQLKFAQRHQPDHYQRQRIQARLSEIANELKDQSQGKDQFTADADLRSQAQSRRSPCSNSVGE